MTCERSWPGGGLPLHELPEPGPELVLAFPDGCRACGSMRLVVEGVMRDGLDEDVHSLAELGEHPATTHAWLRCVNCGALDHRQHRPERPPD